jgi:phosphatidylinositol alpha-mannosyltransferase
MKILQVCPFTWDKPGGVQNHVRQLSTHLRRRGHTVRVLAPGLPPFRRGDVRIVGRPGAVRFNGSVPEISFTPTSARAVREFLREFRPDVIHVHEPLCPSTSMLATWYANAPLVATFHANFPHDVWSGRIYSIVAPLLQPTFRKLDRRLAVSNAARHTVASRMGDANFEIVPNGSNVDVFATAEPAPLPEGRKLLFVGRLERRKGFPVALQAFASLADAYPDLRLVVVGDGPDREAVETFPAALRARVHMMGKVSDDALPTFHRASDIFVSPATGSESFGIVLVEAMAAGLPVVASDIPGYRDVARHEVEGLLVTPTNPEALAVGVRRLLEDPALAAALGARGAQRARAFAWESIVDRLEEIYGDLAGRDTAERSTIFAEV